MTAAQTPGGPLGEALPSSHRPIEAERALAVGQVWEIAGENEERLRFRQVRAGEAFTVRDAAGAWFRARLRIERSVQDAAPRLTGTVFEAMPCPESPLWLVLLQAVLGRERMFWVVQKATELGAAAIVPVFTERSLGPDDLAREKAHRWPAAIVRAVAQCRRGTVPLLLPAVTLEEALALPLWREAQMRWAMVEPRGDGRAAGGVGSAPGCSVSTAPGSGGGHPLQPRRCTSAALLVGPEGGWTAEEAARIETAGALPARLGGRVLRAETAALVGMTALQMAFGDLQRPPG